MFKKERKARKLGAMLPHSLHLEKKNVKEM